MATLLAVLNLIIAAFLAWAIYFDIAHDKNEWWGTSLLCLWFAVAAVTAATLWARR